MTLLHAWSGTASAQPVTRDVLDRLDIKRGEQSVAIHIHFRFPVQYVRHFPVESGDTLLIHVAPTVLKKREDDTPRREALPVPKDADAPLVDVVFDERTLWNPYLMLHFSRRVDFRVSQGRDFRSIVVDLPLAPPPAPTARPSPADMKE